MFKNIQFFFCNFRTIALEFIDKQAYTLLCSEFHAGYLNAILKSNNKSQAHNYFNLSTEETNN